MNELAGEIYKGVFEIAGVSVALLAAAIGLGVYLILRAFKPKGEKK